MSGLYNAIFNSSPTAGLALLLLGQPASYFGRFRDAWIEEMPDNTYRIAVYTRNGGGNREHCGDSPAAGADCPCQACAMEHRIPQHPLYLFDQDDSYDSTYAVIYFKLPDDARSKMIAAGAPTDFSFSEIACPPIDTGKRWQDALAALNRP